MKRLIYITLIGLFTASCNSKPEECTAIEMNNALDRQLKTFDSIQTIKDGMLEKMNFYLRMAEAGAVNYLDTLKLSNIKYNLQLKEWEKIKNLAEEKYSKLEKKCSEFDKK